MGGLGSYGLSGEKKKGIAGLQWWHRPSLHALDKGRAHQQFLQYEGHQFTDPSPALTILADTLKAESGS